MAHTRGYNNSNSTTLSADSVSTLSFGGGGGDAENVIKNSQISGEIDKLLSQLKCKRAFQDEDSLHGPAASVFSTQEVSRLIAFVCGVKKNELKPDVRQTLKEMEEFFKELIMDTNVSNGIKVKEGLNELFHNPEHIVFQNLLSNEPADWGKLVMSILLDMQRKEVLKVELQKDIQDFQAKRREVAKDVGLEKKRLGELQVVRKEKEDKIQTDNIRRLKIALDSDKAEANKIEEELSKHGKVITNNEVEDLVTKFAELKARRDNLKDELQNISVDGILPPDFNDATVVMQNRKCYLESLLYQIANPLDVSAMESSADNSVFLRKSSH